MNPDKIYREGFLRAIRLLREAINANRTLSILERIWLENTLKIMEKRAEKPMLTEMQGVI